MEHGPIDSAKSFAHSESHIEEEMKNIYQQEIAESAIIIKKEANLVSSEKTIINYLKNTETEALQRLSDLDHDKGVNLSMLISYVTESCTETMYDLGYGKPSIFTRISENLLSSKNVIFDEMQSMNLIKTSIDTINFKETIAEARLEGLRIVHSGDSSALDKVKYLFAQELVSMFLLDDMEVLPQLKLLFSVDEMAAIIKSTAEMEEETEDFMDDVAQDKEGGSDDGEPSIERKLLTSIGVHEMISKRIDAVRKEREQNRFNRAFEIAEKSIDGEREYTIAVIKKYNDVRDFVDDVLDIGNMPA